MYSTFQWLTALCADHFPSLAVIIEVYLICILWCSLSNIVLAVTAQVTLESLSPQPTCANQMLVYTCQVDFFFDSTVWRHIVFGSLEFIAGVEEESTMSTSNGRVIANFAMNDEQQMVVSTLTFLPPLNNLTGTNLNDTTLRCEGRHLLITIRPVVQILLFGKWQDVWILYLV